MSEFFAMGGYGAFVWPAYAVTAIVLGGLIIASLRAHRAAKRDLAKLAGQTRRGHPAAD